VTSLPATDPIDLINRLDYRRRTLPPGAACSVCGISWPILLHRCRTGILCYQCLRVARGRAGWELHHIGGDPSPFVVLVPGNLHRLLSFWQDLTWRDAFPPASREAFLSDAVGILFVGTWFLRSTS
jgi:hypothetical protein